MKEAGQSLSGSENSHINSSMENNEFNKKKMEFIKNNLNIKSILLPNIYKSNDGNKGEKDKNVSDKDNTLNRISKNKQVLQISNEEKNRILKEITKKIKKYSSPGNKSGSYNKEESPSYFDVNSQLKNKDLNVVKFPKIYEMLRKGKKAEDIFIN